MAQPSPSHLYGIVDMGSNGIRFSISDLSPPTARSLPTVFQSRTGISLYDAQYSTGVRGPIPQSTIDEVLESLQRFKITCADFGVPESNINVLATEATRTAANSEDYRRQIREATGWEVQMLAKEMEGRIGAMGVASSFQAVEGLVMDLGGGSTQITWMTSRAGDVQTSPQGSISFPYGAAALTRRLSEIESQSGPHLAKEQLAAEMKSNFQTAYRDLAIPSSSVVAQSAAAAATAAETEEERAEGGGGLTLYLSGGGFRGWGYLLMSQSTLSSPYPIPIINGFRVSKSNFQSITSLQQVAADTTKQGGPEIFRLSKRRAAQVPAVAFLVNVLCLAIPEVAEIRFCQGGVREGFLFGMLDRETRAVHPLIAACRAYAAPGAAELADILRGAIPSSPSPTPSSSTPAHPIALPPPRSFTHGPLLQSLTSLLHAHSPHPKESASLSALHLPITGPLASAHGISHRDRALLALMLCQRWSGELAPPHESLQERLRRLLTSAEVWWVGYVGVVAGVLGGVYPAGVGVSESGNAGRRLGFRTEWVDSGLGKKGVEGGLNLWVLVRKGDPMTAKGWREEVKEGIERVGKRKHWVGGKEGVGVRVEVRFEEAV